MRRPPVADISTVDLPEGDERAGSRSPLVPALTIAWHQEARRAGERLLLTFARGGSIALSRNEPTFLRPGAETGTPLADVRLSRKPLVLSQAPNGGLRLDPGEGSRVMLSGQALQGPQEVSPEEIAAGVPLVLGESVVLVLHLADPGPSAGELGMAGASAALERVRRHVLQVADLAVPVLVRGETGSGMAGASAALERVRRHVLQVADLAVPVLVRGETGSGKELVARAIHQNGPRRHGPFVSVNLAAIPRELAAAELFGARKGAFTGAVKDQHGFFQAAEGGTLFLDEVGEAPPEVQVMLLRVLETGEIYSVGERTPSHANVRLVAATDADLERHIDEGRFKAPLLHRLAGFTIRVPALRERREDVGPLFHRFAREELEAIGEAGRLDGDGGESWLPAGLAAALVAHGWPGNVRQLRNVARQLVIANRGQPQLRLDAQLEQELMPGNRPPAARPAPAARTATSRRRPADISEAELLATLRECGWDFQATAERLGVHRTSIYDLIERSPNIRTAGDLSVEEITRCHQECGGDLDAMVRRLEVSHRALARRLKELGLRSGSP